MRVAALYDIHGNPWALDAVLADIERMGGVDCILIGGDIAWGPELRETIDRLTASGDRFRALRGNADREVVTRRGPDGADPASKTVLRTRWAAEQITDAQRAWLGALPEGIVLEIDGLGPTRFCHGSPRSDEEILTRASPDDRLREALAGVGQDVVVCGHTHVQFDRMALGKRLVNAGSVGMPYEGRSGAYWAWLGPDVTLRRTEYDVETAVRAIRASGFPARDEWAQQLIEPLSADWATAFFEGIAAKQPR